MSMYRSIDSPCTICGQCACLVPNVFALLWLFVAASANQTFNSSDIETASTDIFDLNDYNVLGIVLGAAGVSISFGIVWLVVWFTSKSQHKRQAAIDTSVRTIAHQVTLELTEFSDTPKNEENKRAKHAQSDQKKSVSTPA